MKLSATTTSTSIAALLEAEGIKDYFPVGKPCEFEISVGSGDSVFIETLDDEASTTTSQEITSSFRFKTYHPEKVFVIASESTDFYITLVG